MPEAQLLGQIGVDYGLIAGNPLTLPPGSLVDARNVTWSAGRLKKRRGFVVIKADGVGTKRVRLAFFFRTSAGDPRLVAATQSDLYSYNSGTNSFDDKGNLSGGDIPEMDACEWGLGMVYVTKHGLEFQKWDGGVGSFAAVGATAAPPGGGSGVFLPTYLRPFGGSLVGANCNVDATQYQQAVYWSCPGYPDEWDNGGGHSGFGSTVRTDLRGEITGIERVGRGLAIFAEENIEIMQATGDADTPYIWDPADATVGCPSPHSICRLGPPYSGQLVFLGSDFNIHAFDGIRTIPQADAIHPLLRELLELDYLRKAWGQVYPLEGIYRLAVPASGGTENNLIIEWHYRRGQWYLHEFAGDAGAWSASARWVKSTPYTYTQLISLGWLYTDLTMTYAELMQATGWRGVAFLGSSGDFVGVFEGLNDGDNGISAYAEFAPSPAPGGKLAEGSYWEILDDRTATSSTLLVRSGASRDGSDSAGWNWKDKSHSLAPTPEPFVDCRQQGRWFTLRVVNTALSGEFGLRGFKLWGIPNVGAKL